jgi:ankyrin repeat protein
MTFDEVHKVIKRGDALCMRHALEAGLNPDLSNRYQWTILMLAAMEGNTEIGRLLITAGANLNRRNQFGVSALSLAVETGHPSFVRLLLTHGASLDCDPDGTSLDIFLGWVEKYCAVTKDQIEHIRELFEAERRLRTSFPPS